MRKCDNTKETYIRYWRLVNFDNYFNGAEWLKNNWLKGNLLLSLWALQICNQIGDFLYVGKKGRHNK